LCFHPNAPIDATLINEINQYVLQKTGFAIQFTQKAYRTSTCHRDLLAAYTDQMASEAAERERDSCDPIERVFVRTDLEAAKILLERLSSKVKYTHGHTFLCINNEWTCNQDTVMQKLHYLVAHSGLYRVRLQGTTPSILPSTARITVASMPFPKFYIL
jgi:hypothetical protein